MSFYAIIVNSITMKQTISETIDGSIKNIIQLKTVDNSLEYS